MKVRFLIGSVFLISFLSMQAQENFSVSASIKAAPTDNVNFNTTDITVNYQKKLGAKNSITNTLEYSNLKINYDLNSFDAYTDQDRLNQIQNKFEFSREISSQTKVNLTVIPTANFQQNLDFSDLTILGNLEIDQQLSSKTNVILGAGRTSIFGKPRYTPTLAFNYKMNEKMNFKIGFPDSKISYSNNERNQFWLTNSFNGNFYHLDQNENTNAKKAVLSQMTSAFEYERNVDHNWFLNFKAGYDFNKKYNLLDHNNAILYDYNTGNSFVFGVGIKYKQ